MLLPWLRLISGGLVAALVTPTLTHAFFDPESGRPVYRNFRPTEYRGHPQVYAVDNAPGRGTVYLSSEQGVLEYDGTRWRTLPVSTRRLAPAGFCVFLGGPCLPSLIRFNVRCAICASR